MSIIRKIVDKAGARKIELEHCDEKMETRLLAEALKEVVIQKEEESKTECLHKALEAHFDVDLRTELKGGRFDQKVEILVNHLISGV